MTDRTVHSELHGRHFRPDHPWWSYQVRRSLGETQLGGGAVSECFQAVAPMTPGDDETWYREWFRVARRNHARSDPAETVGHVRRVQMSTEEIGADHCSIDQTARCLGAGA